MNQVGDIQSLGLGSHVDSAIAEHRAAHTGKVDSEQQKRQLGREERKEKAEALGTNLVQAIKAAGKWEKSDAMKTMEPKELDNGTLMFAHLQPIGTFEDAVNAVCSPKYVNEGALAQQYKSKVMSDADIQTYKLDQGLVVNVSLQSRDEELNIETEHQVHVGNLIDPESVLVPMEDDGTDVKTYEIIDQSDSRFSAIMNLVQSFFESDAARISKEFSTKE